MTERAHSQMESTEWGSHRSIMCPYRCRTSAGVRCYRYCYRGVELICRGLDHLLFAFASVAVHTPGCGLYGTANAHALRC